MKKLIRLLFILGAIAFINCIEINAQTPKRIQFAKGKSSVTVKGSTGSAGMTYVVRARSGQKLIVDLMPVSKVGIKVETVGRFGEMVLLREEGGGRYEIGLEETGDYTIFIGSIGDKPVSFTLAVAVKRLADI